jgi:hypothetical protein
MFRKYRAALREEKEAKEQAKEERSKIKRDKQDAKEERRKRIRDKQSKADRARVQRMCERPKHIPRTRVWNKEQCALIPRGHNRSTARDACDTAGIEQCHGTCYFVSVMVLLTKLKMIYNKLSPATKRYVDSIKTCPRINRPTCVLAPRPVREKYAEMMESKRGEKKEINKEKAFQGGYADILFQAVLADSKIPYSWIQWTGGISGIDGLSNVVVGFERNLRSFLQEADVQAEQSIEKHRKIYSIHDGNLDTTPLYSIISFHFISGSVFRSVMIKLRHLVSKFTSIVGGHVNLVRKGGRYHSVAFSVCGTRILMCNWGLCGDPMILRSIDGKKKLSEMYSVTSVFLIFDNGLVRETLKK